jgi:hypothetical protein
MVVLFNEEKTCEKKKNIEREQLEIKKKKLAFEQ